SDLGRTSCPSPCLIVTKFLARLLRAAAPGKSQVHVLIRKEHRVRWIQRWSQEGGGRELLRLAIPLILSSSFMTLQITIDRALLSQASSDAVAAAMPAALVYWTFLTLLQNTAGYATTFVAQYT